MFTSIGGGGGEAFTRCHMPRMNTKKLNQYWENYLKCHNDTFHGIRMSSRNGILIMLVLVHGYVGIIVVIAVNNYG